MSVIDKIIKQLKEGPMHDYCGWEDQGPGECEDAEGMTPGEKKRNFYDLGEAEGWKDAPKGWTGKSIKKFAKSLTGKEGTQKDFFDKCVKKMKGKVSNPEAFCASIKDETHGSTFWRGKGKTPQQAGKDVKKIQNVKQESSINEEEKIQKGHTLKCNICGREALIKVAGTGPLVCCDKPMRVKNLLEDI